MAELLSGKIQPVTHELIGAARALADARGSQVWVIMMGSSISAQAASLFPYGADTVVVVDDVWMAGFIEEIEAKVMVRLIKQYKPEILVKDIPFYSVCEHHLVPFIDKAHVAYIPANGKITGLSKLARVVEDIAKRPQLQERLTNEIDNVLMECMTPQGVAVVIEAEHLCMSMRGVKKPGSKTITSAVRGLFRTSAKTRSEFFALINS